MMDLVNPHRVVTKNLRRMLYATWATALFVAWGLSPSAIIPGPVDVLSAVPHLWNGGLLQDLLTSLWLNLEAIGLSTVISLGLAYITVLPAFRPPVEFFAKLRFLGLTGLTFLFGLALAGHELKLGLLVFGMSVFLVTGMSSVVRSIPQEKLDHARTLGMSEWRTVWEVVVLGTMHEAIEIVRQNAAIGWMMLTMVEGLVRSEGGLGTMLLNENKHFNLSSVFALQFIILALGLLQDYAINWVRRLLCPYSDLRNIKT
jgi:NitT/TauT family transport system permease protein